MPITFEEKTKQFYISTDNTTYIIELLDGKIPVHRYWGNTLKNMPSIENTNADFNTIYCIENTENPSALSTGTLPLEYGIYGTGDMREPAVSVQLADGSFTLEPEYLSHKIYKGKRSINGLPSSYAVNDDATTLELTLADKASNINIILYYTVFEEYDIITRSTKIVNLSEKPIDIKRISSACVDFYDSSLEIVHLPGSWARERHIERSKPNHGIMRFDSKRGASGHCENPFIAMCEPNATETNGDVYAMNLVYSGNFEIVAELDPFNTLRTLIGINSFNFSWKLNPNEEFASPETVMTYSSKGFGDMSRNLHNFYRNRLCRGKYQHSARPVLINNWEATYFDFNEEKILAIAEKAKEVGIDMLVLDDGWFGKRNNDDSSLGDWYSNKEKLPNGLAGLGKKLNGLGMKFGVWFEPEMVSPDSDLYKIHPDWCIHIDGRTPHLGRNQLVLDLSRIEVCDYIIGFLTETLSNAPISYVKWDMNRYISDISSTELSHRYMLGLYSVLEAVTSKFPDVLFEGCAGGGGRFDPGMLYYFPQIWCSDDTDAVERLYIQYGTSFAYPTCTMGSHISACPNHQIGRTTPFSMRGNVAMSGQFGYELDLSTLTVDEIKTAKEQVAFYKAHRETIQFGDMFRLSSPFESNIASWQYISKDKNEVVAFFFTITGKANTLHKMIKLQGLETDCNYKCAENGKIYSGAYLMQFGLPAFQNADYISNIIVLKKEI